MTELEEGRRRLLTSLRTSITDERVLRAMERVPRERFVPPEHRDMAYEDIPLPIGAGQTISQPFIVALMTEALGLTGTEKVLEIGTGSGYQAAILGCLAGKVVTVERFPDLAESAAEKLRKLGLLNVDVHVARESLGWPEEAPYDAIIVTAAAPRVPQSLLDQLKDGGRIVIPVGTRWDQELVVVTKSGDCITRASLGGCRFVPLIGSEAWPEAGPVP